MRHRRAAAPTVAVAPGRAAHRPGPGARDARRRPRPAAAGGRAAGRVGGAAPLRRRGVRRRRLLQRVPLHPAAVRGAERDAPGAAPWRTVGPHRLVRRLSGLPRLRLVRAAVRPRALQDLPRAGMPASAAAVRSPPRGHPTLQARLALGPDDGESHQGGGSIMIRRWLCLLGFLLAVPARLIAAEPPNPWAGWKMLLGDWIADASQGKPGAATSGSLSFTYDLDHHVIVRRDRADYPALEGRPAF